MHIVNFDFDFDYIHIYNKALSLRQVVGRAVTDRMRMVIWSTLLL